MEVVFLSIRTFLVTVLICFLSSSVLADEVLLLTNTLEAEKVRLDLIDIAREEIWISSYILKEDQIGLKLAASLLTAKRKNPDLKINLILDGLNYSSLTKNVSPELVAYLYDEGVNMFSYHPITIFHPTHIN